LVLLLKACVRYGSGRLESTSPKCETVSFHGPDPGEMVVSHAIARHEEGRMTESAGMRQNKVLKKPILRES
jgi:hypothetical protein